MTTSRPDHDVVLPFVQLHFTHGVGVPIGVYPVRAAHCEDGGRDTLLSEVLGAPAGRRRGRGAPQQRIAGDEARPVHLAVLTLVRASSPLTRGTAAAQLATWRGSTTESDLMAARAIDVINVALRAYRAAAEDPYVTEITAADARATIIGFGAPGVIGAGEWEDAFTLARADGGPPRRPSPEELRVLARVAGALEGRFALFDAEDVALRALLDLDRGRPDAARGQAREAVRLLKAELAAQGVDTSMVAADPELPDVAAVEATARHVLSTAGAYHDAIRDLR